MALAPVNFQIQQPRRSIIEEAFGTALAALATQAISAPFERRREARQIQGEKDLAQNREDIRLKSIPEELRLSLNDWRTRQREQSALDIQEIPKRLAAQTQGQVDALGILRQHTVEPGTELMIDQIQRTLGGISAANIAKPTSLAELEQIGPLLNTAVGAANVAEERNRNNIERENSRAIREASLFPPLTTEELGETFVNTETGKPLSTLDMQLLKAGVRGQITTSPEFAPYKGRALELSRLREAGKLVRPQLDQKNLMQMHQWFTGKDAAQTLMIHAQAYPFLLWKNQNEQLDLGNVNGVTGWMAGNQDLLDALSASHLARDMDEVKQSELATGLRLLPRALGYLSLIYQQQGKPFEHPDARIPEEIPETQLRELGQTRMRTTSSARNGADSGQVSRGGDPFNTTSRLGATFQRGSPLYAGFDISAERRDPEYLELQQGLQTLLRTGPNPRGRGVQYDSTMYRQMEADMLQNHASPEKALKYYTDLGVPKERLRNLFEGDSTSQRLALDVRLRDALQALQNARDAIVAH